MHIANGQTVRHKTATKTANKQCYQISGFKMFNSSAEELHTGTIHQNYLKLRRRNFLRFFVEP